MPNVYFCEGHAGDRGFLRAVLSLQQLKEVVSTHTCFYLGKKFPVSSDHTDEANQFAVLSIGKEQSDQDWRPGFYRFETGVMELDKALRELSL